MSSIEMLVRKAQAKAGKVRKQTSKPETNIKGAPATVSVALKKIKKKFGFDEIPSFLEMNKGDPLSKMAMTATKTDDTTSVVSVATLNTQHVFAFTDTPKARLVVICKNRRQYYSGKFHELFSDYVKDEGLKEDDFFLECKKSAVFFEFFVVYNDLRGEEGYKTAVNMFETLQASIILSNTIGPVVKRSKEGSTPNENGLSTPKKTKKKDKEDITVDELEPKLKKPKVTPTTATHSDTKTPKKTKSKKSRVLDQLDSKTVSVPRVSAEQKRAEGIRKFAEKEHKKHKTAVKKEKERKQEKIKRAVNKSPFIDDEAQVDHDYDSEDDIETPSDKEFIDDHVDDSDEEDAQASQQSENGDEEIVKQGKELLKGKSQSKKKSLVLSDASDFSDFSDDAQENNDDDESMKKKEQIKHDHADKQEGENGKKKKTIKKKKVTSADDIDLSWPDPRERLTAFKKQKEDSGYDKNKTQLKEDMLKIDMMRVDTDDEAEHQQATEKDKKSGTTGENNASGESEEEEETDADDDEGTNSDEDMEEVSGEE